MINKAWAHCEIFFLCEPYLPRSEAQLLTAQAEQERTGRRETPEAEETADG